MFCLVCVGRFRKSSFDLIVTGRVFVLSRHVQRSDYDTHVIYVSESIHVDCFF